MTDRLILILQDSGLTAKIKTATQILDNSGIGEALIVYRSKMSPTEPLSEDNMTRLANLQIYQMGYQQAIRDILGPSSVTGAKALIKNNKE